MAEEKENRKGYPSMPTTSWWALRKRFKGTIPREVTSNYLASALNTGEESARNNILPSLRKTKIIDKDGKPTERAVKWRDDAQYPNICEEVRKELYPEDLLALAPDAKADRDEVEQWFANHTGAGQSMVYKMASFYLMLCQADPSKEAEPVSASPAPKAAAPRRERVVPAARARSAAGSAPAPAGAEARSGLYPALNINVEIHISADASPEQIDQIFASMAKHLRQQT